LVFARFLRPPLAPGNLPEFPGKRPRDVHETPWNARVAPNGLSSPQSPPKGSLRDLPEPPKGNSKDPPRRPKVTKNDPQCIAKIFKASWNPRVAPDGPRDPQSLSKGSLRTPEPPKSNPKNPEDP